MRRAGVFFIVNLSIGLVYCPAALLGKFPKLFEEINSKNNTDFVIYAALSKRFLLIPCSITDRRDVRPTINRRALLYGKR
jgi:hypothetical protein